MSCKRKIPLGENVLDAAQKRIEWLFDTFEQITLSFSGGKDSTVLFHLVAAEARRRHRKFNVMFLDWEVQYSATISHVAAMKSLYADCTQRFYWIALPVTTESGISQYEPAWTAWEPGKKWVRQPPEDAITDPDFFPFYHPGIIFEDFTPSFNQWITGDHHSSVILLGIRADESLNRFLAISNNRKLRYADDIPWTTASPEGFYYMGYPIYDWHVKDIWTYISRSRLPYNTIYDLMHQAGVSLSKMRICEPFGPEQRRGLWLYHVLEPETWSLACARVSGADAGMLYTRPGNKAGFFGSRQISKPAGHTWKSTPVFYWPACRKKLQNTTGTKLRSICTGMQSGIIRTGSRMNNPVIQAVKIFRPGDGSAKPFYVMISGAAHWHSARPNLIATTSIAGAYRQNAKTGN